MCLKIINTFAVHDNNFFLCIFLSEANFLKTMKSVFQCDLKARVFHVKKYEI